jgi:hypothetical protein
LSWNRHDSRPRERRTPGRIASDGRVEEFLSHDRDVAGCLDAEADMVPAEADDRDRDPIADENRLVQFAAEGQHRS